jgi:hypothetical protein
MLETPRLRREFRTIEYMVEIHCYKPAMRVQARAIMRYAGPRVPFRHPWLRLAHVLDKLHRVEHPMVQWRREHS